MPTVELSFSALPGHVRTARLIAAVVARRAGIEEALLDEVRLAVGEACTRAVDLHRQYCPQVPVQVTLTHDIGHFEVLVRDCAPAEGTLGPGALEALEQEAAGPAGAREVPAARYAQQVTAGSERITGGSAQPDPPGTEPGFEPLPPGVGLAVIGGIVDEVDVEADEQGARVRMRWPVLPPRPRSGSPV